MSNNILNSLNYKGTQYDINISDNMAGDGLTIDNTTQKLKVNISTGLTIVNGALALDENYANNNNNSSSTQQPNVDLSNYATKAEVNAKYTKPSNGIPKTDLNSSVQTSLNKADNAISGITFNGNDAAVVNGVVQINGVLTEVNVEEETVYFVEGESSEGSGDSTNGETISQNKEIVEVSIEDFDLGEDYIRFFNAPMRPDVIYVCTERKVRVLDIEMYEKPTKKVAEYTIYFTTSDETPSAYIFFPNLLWVNGTTPQLEPNTTYELSIVATKLLNDYVYKGVLTPFKSLE